jgi:hypothetical protein
MSCLLPACPVTSPFHEFLTTALRLHFLTIRYCLDSGFQVRATRLADVQSRVAEESLDAQPAEQAMEQMVM